MPVAGRRTAAVIVAAGSSLRMGGDTSKQFLNVCGLPVLAHTLLAFERCAQIDEIVVVARAEEVELVSALAAAHGIQKFKTVVAGGDTRADSAKRGFAAIGSDADYVAVHDGARCLVTPAMIEAVCEAAYIHGAATAAAAATDTVKYATPDGFVEATPDRSRVFLASTPQIFCTALYEKALKQEGIDGLTDDNQLVERLGHPVKLVDCGKLNMKITFPEDIPLAETILKEREAL